MKNGDEIEFYYQSKWNDGFYVGKFPSDNTVVVVANEHTSYLVGRPQVRERPKKKVKPLKELVNTLFSGVLSQLVQSLLLIFR